MAASSAVFIRAGSHNRNAVAQPRAFSLARGQRRRKPRRQSTSQETCRQDMTTVVLAVLAVLVPAVQYLALAVL